METENTHLESQLIENAYQNLCDYLNNLNVPGDIERVSYREVVFTHTGIDKIGDSETYIYNPKSQKFEVQTEKGIVRGVLNFLDPLK